MNIAFYNENGVGDTLLVTLAKSSYAEQEFDRVGDVARIYQTETDQTVGYNFFNISQLTKISEVGQVKLDEALVTLLNEQIAKAGFKELLAVDDQPKFVVGFVKECVPHEDSDHLSVTQIELDQNEVVQIVCGASNIAQGQKVVIAKIGAVMPSGMIIWDGELRGKRSQGMVCSAKELGLANAPAVKGILVLDDTVATGKAFDPATDVK
ncbi:YtpR family tRNA-binding protein [Isobaculum melis]|uniref:tRNA-binding protein n=1 Tax=Isobaculum melis TaxID=142588 RepID=A0A1H9S7V9_9LACT|nr:DUF4479 and tRNA-binding domain-containing protein [Isobaculum melis]SER80998.1 tRNA-binding protein [Isobaculum melis]